MTENIGQVGLIIPLFVAQSKLTPAEKLIAGIVFASINSKGISDVNNSFIADMAGLSQSIVARSIVPMCKFCGLKIAVSEPGGNPKTCRIIKVPQSVVGQCADLAGTYSTIINKRTTKTTTTTTPLLHEIQSEKWLRWKREILHYLNTKLKLTGACKFTSGSPLSSRFKDGADFEDCILIIDYKFAEWGNNPKMRQWIRPLTLFSIEHFPEYLQAANVWDEGGRQEFVEDRSSVKAEIKTELQAKERRLFRKWELLGEEFDLLEINPDKTPEQEERMYKIVGLREELSAKGKEILEKISKL